MSERNQQSGNPMSAMFDLQRQTVQQGQQWIQQSMNAQKQAPQVWRDAIESGRSVQQTGNEAARSVWKTYADVLRASIPSDENNQEAQQAFENLNDAIDSQFQAVNDINQQTWNTLEQNVNQNSDAYTRFVDQYSSFVNDSMNAFTQSMQDVQGQMEQTMEEGAQTARRTSRSASSSSSDNEE
jgi:hypothetical protein